MSVSSYVRDLNHPKWQKKRLEILQRDKFTCQHCGTKNHQLHAHHLNYKKGKKPWNYSNDNLLTLCKPCHQRVTELVIRIRENCRHVEFVTGLADYLKSFQPKPKQSTIEFEPKTRTKPHDEKMASRESIMKAFREIRESLK